MIQDVNTKSYYARSVLKSDQATRYAFSRRDEADAAGRASERCTRAYSNRHSMVCENPPSRVFAVQKDKQDFHLGPRRDVPLPPRSQIRRAIDEVADSSKISESSMDRLVIF